MAPVEHINPEHLHKNPAFTHVVSVSGPARTVYIGGQNAVNAFGDIVGPGDVGEQTEQTFRNLQTALEAAGADFEHIIKWTIYVVQGQPAEPGFAVFQKLWGRRPYPPLVSVIFVAGLAHPDFLVEIEAVAVVPE
jgi:enamine deaminase RidA (YjgF/YER057c/UK114 family)